jgi:predicted TIM-barrel fold metal-dependent hydrolase
MNERVIIVSADGHAAAPVRAYRPYLESKYHAALDELEIESKEYVEKIVARSRPGPEELTQFDDRQALAGGGEDGSFDLDLRLREMDAEGCACEILHSGTQTAPQPWHGSANRPCSEELQWAGLRAYHRWTADFIAGAKGRLVGVAEPGPCRDMDATIAELEWVASHGFASVTLPGMIADPALPPFYDRYYDRFWAACADLNLVLSLHAGWGMQQGLIYALFDAVSTKYGSVAAANRMEQEETIAATAMHGDEAHMRRERQVMWQLMLGGAFDRHPGLRLALTEVRADWVPGTLAALDKLAASAKAPLKRKPSEYFAAQCAVAPSSIHLSEIAMRHEIGVRQIMFGMDYPHYEGTWPNTREWIRAAFDGVPEDEARLILGENAITFYRLDRAKLQAVADQIGPRASEVLGGGAAVEQRLTDHFEKRAGFRRAPEEVDVAAIATAFHGDLAGVAARP